MCQLLGRDDGTSDPPDRSFEHLIEAGVLTGRPALRMFHQPMPGVRDGERQGVGRGQGFLWRLLGKWKIPGHGRYLHDRPTRLCLGCRDRTTTPSMAGCEGKSWIPLGCWWENPGDSSRGSSRDSGDSRYRYGKKNSILSQQKDS